MSKTKSLIILILLAISPFITCFSQVKTQVSISGKINNNNFTSAVLYKIANEITEVQKTALSPDGSFALNHDIVVADFYKLEFDKNNFIMLILKPGEVVEITTDANDFLKQLKITGSKETMQIFANQKIIDETKFKLDSISNLSYQSMANPKYDSLTKQYQQSYDQINLLKKQQLTNFMLSNSTSLANLFLPEAFPVDENLETYQKMDSDLFKTYPNNFHVNNLHNQIIAAKKSMIGSEAPDFTLPDTSGVNITLSSLRGKYVLIDFWAGWCGPCMKEMPNVKKLYADFKNKGFEILGVSLDKTRASWTNAIKNNHLSWKQVSDIKFWQSIVVPLYGIKAIPYTVLLDKEGKIIAKNLRGEELYRKVGSLIP